MAKQILSVDILAAPGSRNIELPRKAELVHIGRNSESSIRLTFIADPMEPKEKVPILILTNMDLISPKYPYYLGTSVYRHVLYVCHLFSNRPLDPYNPRHYPQKT